MLWNPSEGGFCPQPAPLLRRSRAKCRLLRHRAPKPPVTAADKVESLNGEARTSPTTSSQSQAWHLGGFGVMGWVSASDYNRGQPDPLADSMAEIIQHMNTDHKDALVLLAQKFARIESQEATMTTVDRLGFQVRLTTGDGIRGARIAFVREVSNPAETRKVLVEMVQQARSQAE